MSKFTMIEKISILSGHGRQGRPDVFDRIDLTMGQVVSIVGPTGSGKTTLINDLELFADGDTPTGRRMLINDQPAPPEFRYNPARNPIALITQHTTFLSDLPVREFLLTHSRVRTGNGESPELVAQTIEFANKLTGEPIDLDNRDDGAFRRPDPGAVDRRRDGHLQHAGGLARRGGERRHPSHPGHPVAAASTARSSSS